MSERKSGEPLALLKAVEPTALSESAEAARRQRIVGHIKQLRASLGGVARPVGEAPPRRRSLREFDVSWRRVAAVVLPMAAAAALWLAWGDSNQPAPLLVVASGEVVVESNAGEQYLHRDERWSVADAVNVATRASAASLTLPSRASLQLDSETRATVERATPATARTLAVPLPDGAAPISEVVRVSSGSVRLTSSEPAERTVVVVTQHAQVVVRGTLFAVLISDAPGDRQTHVVLSRGQASVHSLGEEYRLTEGQRWSSGSATDQREGSRQTAPDTDTARGAVDAGAETGQVENKKASRKGGTSDLAEQNRLFETARAARRAGQSDRALQLFSELMTRFPASEQAHNARVEHFRLLRSLGRTEQARRSAQAYLRAYPRGFAAAEARQLTR